MTWTNLKRREIKEENRFVNKNGEVSESVSSVKDGRSAVLSRHVCTTIAQLTSAERGWESQQAAAISNKRTTLKR